MRLLQMGGAGVYQNSRSVDLGVICAHLGQQQVLEEKDAA